MRVGELYNPQVALQMVAFDGIVLLPDRRAQVPGDEHIADGENDGADAGKPRKQRNCRSGLAVRTVSLLPDDQEDQLTQQPESAQMNEADYRIDQVQRQRESCAHCQIDQKADQPCPLLPAACHVPENREIRCPVRQIAQEEHNAQEGEDYQDYENAHSITPLSKIVCL